MLKHSVLNPSIKSITIQLAIAGTEHNQKDTPFIAKFSPISSLHRPSLLALPTPTSPPHQPNPHLSQFPKTSPRVKLPNRQHSVLAVGIIWGYTELGSNLGTTNLIGADNMKDKKEANTNSQRFVDLLNEMLSECSCKAVCRASSGCMFVGQSEPSMDDIQLKVSNLV